jgi:hypothetical protein
MLKRVARTSYAPPFIDQPNASVARWTVPLSGSGLASGADSVLAAVDWHVGAGYGRPDFLFSKTDAFPRYIDSHVRPRHVNLASTDTQNSVPREALSRVSRERSERAPARGSSRGEAQLPPRRICCAGRI